MDNPKQKNYIPALRFHWLTPCYDTVVGASTREKTIKQALIAQANLAPSQRVLDLGCGTGALAPSWSKNIYPRSR